MCFPKRVIFNQQYSVVLQPSPKLVRNGSIQRGESVIINEHRREFIAKPGSDLGKTIFAVGSASYFFEKFPINAKIGLWLAFAALTLGS